MTEVTNEELLIWLIKDYMPERDASLALEALAHLCNQTPPQAVTRRDDLHNVIARIMQQQVYNSSEISDAVEQYLERLPASPTAQENDVSAEKETSGAVGFDYYPSHEALCDLVSLLSEKEALNGGGPGFQGRWDKAYAYAIELVRGE